MQRQKHALLLAALDLLEAEVQPGFLQRAVSVLSHSLLLYTYASEPDDWLSGSAFGSCRLYSPMSHSTAVRMHTPLTRPAPATISPLVHSIVHRMHGRLHCQARLPRRQT